MHSKATYDFISQNLKEIARPYILSRSNFPGQGKYSFTWLADNYSNEQYMGYSVDGLFAYQMFGMPFIGSDVCGFNGDAKADLCTKWH